jgi:hypothetical protein
MIEDKEAREVAPIFQGEEVLSILESLDKR